MKVLKTQALYDHTIDLIDKIDKELNVKIFVPFEVIVNGIKGDYEKSRDVIGFQVTDKGITLILE